MAWLKNKSQRAFNVGGTILVPTHTTEIPDDFLNNERIKEIIAAGELEEMDGPHDPDQPNPSGDATTEQNQTETVSGAGQRIPPNP